MSSPTIVFNKRAEKELEKIYDWLDKQVDGLAEKFTGDVLYCLDQIKFAPQSYSLITGSTRVASLRNFPYCLYFRIASKSVVRVINILHGSRHPNTWRRRSKPKE